MPEILVRYHLCAQLGPAYEITWDTYDDTPHDKIHLLAHLLSRENGAQRMLAEEARRNPGATYTRFDDEDDPPA